MEGDLSMKSTLSSDNQWNDFRNNRSTNSATNLGERSSLKDKDYMRVGMDHFYYIIFCTIH